MFFGSFSAVLHRFWVVFRSFSARFGPLSHRFAWFSHRCFRFFGIVAVLFAVVGGFLPRRRCCLAVFMDRPLIGFPELSRDFAD